MKHLGCRLPIFFVALTHLALATAPGANAADEIAPEVAKAEKDRIAAIEKVSKTAVSVFAGGGQGGGSGVVITADGYALTNFHVSSPAGNYMQCSMADGQLYDAVIVGLDPTGDVALIKLLGRDDFPHAELGDSDQVRVGDWCFAVGNPFLLATDFQPTISYGIVSGVHRYQYPAGTLLEYADCIQTDAAINPGNSGGPLFNAQGQLIGINGRGSFEKRGRVNVGVGYAISINQIKNFMGYLRSGRIVDHATLGASVSSDGESRVIVSNLLESSDAYRRGLRLDDEIVAFGGRDITSVNGFKNALGVFPKGWRVPLSYRRDGQRFDTYVRLTGVHSKTELLAQIQKPKKIKPPSPKPKEGEAPQKDSENKKPLPRPKKPAKFHAPKKIPKAVAKLLKERSGYANFYFNEQNRTRIWKSFASSSDFSTAYGEWLIEGELNGVGGEVQITLSPEKVEGRFPFGIARLDMEKDFDEQLAPTGSGGLLTALHLWRRMLVEGPENFGEVYYLGSAPVIGRKGVFDVLVATHNVVESRFYFDPRDSSLAAIEMYPDSDVDPCEIFFSDYQKVDGRLIPHRLEIRFGDSIFTDIQIKKITFAKPSENDA